MRERSNDIHAVQDVQDVQYGLTNWYTQSRDLIWKRYWENSYDKMIETSEIDENILPD